MPTKVLVFESDPSFAGELRTELARLGLVAQVVDDGNAGLAAAASERPDLILLSIELPRMNGFSVCNKLKKDPVLKDVPLIIMSSESSDETFEQHKKLRTRAEEYVHKPIAFGELLEHMRPYVNWENGDAPASEDAGIIIEDEIEIEDIEESGQPGAAAEGVPASANGSIDAEVEAFAESAFDHLLDEASALSVRSSRPAPQSVRPQPASVPPPEPALVALESAVLESLPPSMPPAAPVVEAVEEPTLAPAIPPPPQPISDSPPTLGRELRLSLMPGAATAVRTRSSMPVAESGDVARMQTEITRLERESAGLRSQVTRQEEIAQQAAQSMAEVQRLQRELDDVRIKAAAGGKVGGVTSREFLDLREALNKKDKEILGLRDQVTRKEKDLLDASDAALKLERDQADLQDLIAALEKDVAAANAMAETARADKDQAAKRAEDFKQRGEKTKTELEARMAELGGIKQRHEAELEAKLQELAAEKAAFEEAARSELARQLEDLRLEHEAASAKVQAELETAKGQAVAAREAELQSEHDQRLGELHRSNQDERNRLEGELARAREEAEAMRARHATELADERMALGRQSAGERAELDETHQRERKELHDRIQDLSNELATRTEERELFVREVAHLKEKIGPLEAELGQATALASDLKTKLAEQTQKVDAALANWEANKGSLEHAKDALAAALSQIEEAEARGLG